MKGKFRDFLTLPLEQGRCIKTMKNAKRLTKNEKIHLSSLRQRLKPDNWLISKKLVDKWLIVNRETGKSRWIPAPQRG